MPHWLAPAPADRSRKCFGDEVRFFELDKPLYQNRVSADELEQGARKCLQLNIRRHRPSMTRSVRLWHRAPRCFRPRMLESGMQWVHPAAKRGNQRHLDV